MGLRVSEELDEKYSFACRLCLEKHKAIYGTNPGLCMFKHVDGEYCNDIETAERISQEKDKRASLNYSIEAVQNILNENNIKFKCINNIITTEFRSDIPQIREVIRSIGLYEDIQRPVISVLNPVSGNMCELAYEIDFTNQA